MHLVYQLAAHAVQAQITGMDAAGIMNKISSLERAVRAMIPQASLRCHSVFLPDANACASVQRLEHQRMQHQGQPSLIVFIAASLGSTSQIQALQKHILAVMTDIVCQHTAMSL